MYASTLSFDGATLSGTSNGHSSSGVSELLSKSEVASFLPSLVVDRCRRGDTRAAAHTQGTIMMADIAKFTSISEALRREHGDNSADKLQELLNGVLQPVINQAMSLGGQVLAFGGDAVIVFWDAPSLAAMGDGISAATATALAVHGVAGKAGVQLRVGVGAGDLIQLMLGEGKNGRVFAFGGPAMQQIKAAMSVASPGDVVLSKAAVDAGRPRLALEGAYIDEANYRATAAVDLEDSMREGMYSSSADLLREDQLLSLDQNLYDVIKTFLTPPIRHLLQQRLTTQWVAELRPLSVVFINLPDIQLAGSVDGIQEAVELLNSAATEILAVVKDLHGSVNKLIIDDKGVSFLCACGLPPHSSTQDPLFACTIALRVRERVRTTVQIGVGTGSVFCGLIGFVRRREYAVIGQAVNRAARLMSDRDVILIDEATHAAAKDQLSAVALTPRTLKGFDTPVPLYELQERASVAHGLSPNAPRHAMVGRGTERRVVVDFLSGIVSAGEAPGRGVIVRGPGGVGKSTLVQTILAVEGLSLIAKVRFAYTVCAEIEQSSPFFPMRTILASMLDVDPTDGDALLVRLDGLVRPFVGEYLDLLSVLPLLNVVFPSLGMPETEATAHLVGEARNSRLRTLIAQLFEILGRDQKMLVVIEDTQWMDSSSWSSLVFAIRSVPELYFVMTTRPEEDPSPEYVSLSTELGGVTVLDLPALGEKDLEELLTNVFGAQSTDPELSRVVFASTNGHPLFAHQVAQHLLEAQVVDVTEQGRAQAKSGREFQAVVANVPGTLKEMVRQRILALPSSFDQITLKTVSVAGLSISLDLLLAVHPSAPSRDELEQSLESLCKMELLRLVAMERGEKESRSFARAPSRMSVKRASPDGVEFQQAVIQSVAYGAMLASQRAEIHQAIAARLEEDITDATRDQHANAMAHHWLGAGRKQDAVPWIERAAEHSFANYANREAVKHLRQLLELSEELGKAAGKRKMIHWKSMLAAALQSTGEFGEAEKIGLEALAMGGLKVTNGGPKMMLGFLGGLREQGKWYRKLEKHPELLSLSNAADEGSMVVDVARAGVAAMFAFYHQQESKISSAVAVKVVNFCFRAGLCAEMANTLAFFSPVPYLLSGQVDRTVQYFDWAVKIAELFGRTDVRAYVLLVRGTIMSSVGGFEDVAEKAYQDARATSLKIGFIRILEDSLSGHSTFRYIHGRFADALEFQQTGLEHSRRRADYQNLGKAHIGVLRVLVKQGKMDEACRELEAAERLEGSLDVGSKIGLAGFQAYMAYFHVRDCDDAVEYLEDFARQVGASLVRSMYVWPGLAAATHTALAILEEHGRGAKLVAKIVGQFAEFAAACQSGKFLARAFQARLLAATGKAGKAGGKIGKLLAEASAEAHGPYQQAVVDVYKVFCGVAPEVSPSAGEWVAADADLAKLVERGHMGTAS